MARNGLPSSNFILGFVLLLSGCGDVSVDGEILREARLEKLEAKFESQLERYESENPTHSERRNKIEAEIWSIRQQADNENLDRIKKLADQRLESIRIKFEDRAQGVVDSVLKKARKAVGTGDFTGALRTLNEFPVDFQGTDLAKPVNDYRREIGKLERLEDRYYEVIRKYDKVRGHEDYEVAWGILRSFYEIEWLPVSIKPSAESKAFLKKFQKQIDEKIEKLEKLIETAAKDKASMKRMFSGKEDHLTEYWELSNPLAVKSFSQ